MKTGRLIPLGIAGALLIAAAFGARQIALARVARRSRSTPPPSTDRTPPEIQRLSDRLAAQPTDLRLRWQLADALQKSGRLDLWGPGVRLGPSPMAGAQARAIT